MKMKFSPEVFSIAKLQLTLDEKRELAKQKKITQTHVVACSKYINTMRENKITLRKELNLKMLEIRRKNIYITKSMKYLFLEHLEKRLFCSLNHRSNYYKDVVEGEEFSIEFTICHDRKFGKTWICTITLTPDFLQNPYYICDCDLIKVVYRKHDVKVDDDIVIIKAQKITLPPSTGKAKLTPIYLVKQGQYSYHALSIEDAIFGLKKRIRIKELNRKKRIAKLKANNQSKM